ncbi:alanine--glyoxylate aminotransferase family protein [Bacillus haynesii]|uniref:pyridoxal-phosphate-dependent aminotransferase family protein n=1 Tax=Bacillus haynesii TaxID=1925021 RepID=UPI002DBB5516|nr:alanine--glyoxylate aminotransferase family protein [Bacillus haynesii]MEC1471696.1 alanine--glyoxylate aminotransferase family protein [Bacillus haynesii]MEC1484330.1 alanine--glyoxylate aminotransferase family protein [Bacillus haynesii]MEC1562688.1 alanine--glyoxylate aminotransferase family protein [Bacillus haynesii]
MTIGEMNIPKRTIMTPGPVEVHPRVLRALSSPVLGQFDPAFTDMMNDVMALLRPIFRTTNKWAFPIDGTSRAGLEAVLASLIKPGDRVLIPIFGRFGYLLAEICERYRADVYTMECPWGDVFEPKEIISEIKRTKPEIVAVVHGETSTGCIQPLEEIGRACRELDVLCVVDAVATIGGTDVNTDEWCLDAVVGGTQKCLSVPSGMAPITFNSRVEKRINERKKVERGIATREDIELETGRLPISSNYFDLGMLMDYWSPRRLNHHTEATSMLYGLREGARVVLEEGLSKRFSRHRLHETALIKGIKAMGLELFTEGRKKLPTVTCVKVPDRVDADLVRKLMLDDFGVEIASSFGPLAGKIWRIGTMGYSCRKENVLFTLAALEAVLIRTGASVSPGNALQAALDFYHE